jgi:hypothetical protein
MPRSKQLAGLARTDRRVLSYGYFPEEDCPHWLYLQSGWSSDRCHQVNGATVKDCLADLSMVLPCRCPDCLHDKQEPS